MKVSLFNAELTMIINAIETYVSEYDGVKETVSYYTLLKKLTTAQEILIKEINNK